jgi:hypothetical protein
MPKQSQIFKNEILRYPRLDTILMIEESMRSSKGDLTLRGVWQSLPKKVMWQTYLTAVDYLTYSGKIILDRDRHPVWIWNPKLMERIKREGIEV